MVIETMTQITDMKLNRAKKRVSIFIDGTFSFSLNKELVIKAGLKKGQDINQNQIKELMDGDLYQLCLNAAIKFLSYRPRSEAEVRQGLKKRGFTTDIINKSIKQLKEQKLIDDAEFAQYWRDNRLSFNPRSKRMIKLELRRKGVDVATIDEISNGIDDEESAYKVGLKRARILASLSYDEFYKYLYNYLGRRGFSYDVINCVRARLWNELRASYE